MKAPRARTEDCIVEMHAGATLVYDSARERAHALRPLAAAVWSLCDGARSPAALAEAARAQGLEADEALVEVVLDGLVRADLPGAARRRRPHAPRAPGPTGRVPHVLTPFVEASGARRWLRRSREVDGLP